MKAIDPLELVILFIGLFVFGFGVLLTVFETPYAFMAAGAFMVLLALSSVLSDRRKGA